VRLEGKVAVVTGAAGGIGAATSRKLVAEGASVVVADLNEPKLHAVAHELGDRVLAVATDVTKEADVAAAVGAAVERFGGIDVLHNNAVSNVPDDRDGVETPDSTWHGYFEVILMAAVWGCRHAIPRMIERGGGALVHTSSLAARVPAGNRIAYGAMKAALESFSAAIAAVHGADGIRSNCVAPGLVVHPGIEAMVPPDQLQRLAATVPLGRLATPEDIADVVAYLASDEAAYVTGQVITANGGGVRARRW
jgi:NAD(P)-dependent dehydrogenase (short-subunit alcohol dehydrogenase family)